MQREELTRYLDDLLDVARYRDYCPNGLQVEGRGAVRHVVAGVTACQALLDAAIARGADTLLVHHGWFWRGEDGRVTGVRKQRLQTLLRHDINLLGYHLPLDGHAEFGNNAQWAKRMGWIGEGRFAEQDVGWHGRPAVPTSLAELTQALAERLQRAPLVIGGEAFGDKPLRRIAWCSGGAIAEGVDVFVSGEISEQTVHLARESGVAYIAAGHHASERYGVQALAEHVAGRFGLRCEFVDIDNPV